MPYPVASFDVLEEADADARALDPEGQSLWAAAKDRLKADAEPSFVLPEADRISPDLPVLCLLKYGGDTAIRVHYHYVAETRAVSVLQVQSLPKHDEKAVAYPRRSTYVYL